MVTVADFGVAPLAEASALAPAALGKTGVETFVLDLGVRVSAFFRFFWGLSDGGAARQNLGAGAFCSARF